MNSSEFIKKIISYGPIKIISGLSNIIVIIILWKVLPFAQYFIYSASVATSLLFCQLFTGWINNAYIFYLPKNQTNPLFLRNNFYLCLLMAFFASSLTWLVSMFMFYNLSLAFISFGLCFCQSVFCFFLVYYQARFLIRKQFEAVLIQNCVQLIMIGYVWFYAKASYEYGVISIMLGFFAANVFFITKIYRELNTNIVNNNSAFFKNMKIISKYGIPTSFWLFFNSCVLASDRYVAYILNIETKEYFSLKELIVGTSGLISMPILMVVHPLFFKLFNAGSYPKKLINDSAYIVFTFFAIFWPIFYFPILHLLTHFTAKPITIPSTTILTTYIGVVLGCVSVYLQKRLEAHKKTSYLAMGMFSCALTCNILSLILGIFLGVNGLAFSFSLAQLIYFIFVYNSISKNLTLIDLLFKPLFFGTICWLYGKAIWFCIDYYNFSANGYSMTTTWCVAYLPVIFFAVKPFCELANFNNKIAAKPV